MEAEAEERKKQREAERVVREAEEKKAKKEEERRAAIELELRQVFSCSYSYERSSMQPFRGGG